MYNWSTDTRELEKDEEKHTIWKLEQLVNFGLGGDKIKKEEIKKYLLKLDIDPSRLKFLQLLLNID